MRSYSIRQIVKVDETAISVLFDANPCYSSLQSDSDQSKCVLVRYSHINCSTSRVGTSTRFHRRDSLVVIWAPIGTCERHGSAEKSPGYPAVGLGMIGPSDSRRNRCIGVQYPKNSWCWVVLGVILNSGRCYFSDS